MMSIDLITISREYGAGGSVLAEALGKRLGWRVLDQGIPAAIARRLGLPGDALMESDEHAATLLERVGQALIMGSPDMLVNTEVAHQPDPADVVRATRELLLDNANMPPLIIVGHGGQVLFRNRPGTLRLRLVAPLDHRIRAVCARKKCTEAAGKRLTRRMDEDRARYLSEYFDADVRDALNYHLVINTAVVELEEQLDLIGRFLEGRRP